jgi:hypothetical protein
MWTDSPIFSMQGTPLIALSQGLLLCATLRSGATNAFPTCCVHALQLAPELAKAGQPLAGAEREQGSSSSSVAAGADAAASSSSSSGSAQQQPEHIGSGATAQGRVAVATAGGAGPVGVSSANTVMLALSDQDRLKWGGRAPLIDDTGGRLTVLLTTPRTLVMATEGGQVLSCRLAAAEEEGVVDAPSSGQAGAPQLSVGAVVHVQQPGGGGGAFISLDL